MKAKDIPNGRMQLLNGKDDCQWLRETHLAGIELPEFKSFVLYGNEDSPDMLVLFRHTDPELDDNALAVIERNPKSGFYMEVS